MVQEFYANAWVTKKHDTSINQEPKNWRTMGRGHIKDFSPKSARIALQLPKPRANPQSYTRRSNTDQRLDQVLADICVSGAQWRRDAQAKPYQLGRLDLKPVARGWLEFIQCSIIYTSNHFEVTIERAVMIHCIMLGSEVGVHEVISQEIYRVVDKPSTQARQTFSHLIHCLCASDRAHMEGDTLIDKERPITRKGMEHVREPAQGPQQEPVPPPPQDILEMHQGMYFPPRDYWD
ncbi:uncharacterized protein DS421_8g226450 [Arachis hypogaea]|nr:uncharacterized protein DS421_8g226450 [Arachis hypogaea]